ncbi:MAG: efflux RND transporter periplasmic adaptor subunit [Saprospiraceae bacterium]|nr:efflux RND transporter periplasmic adaptor subunit [Saprospiraceae bacterium]
MLKTTGIHTIGLASMLILIFSCSDENNNQKQQTGAKPGSVPPIPVKVMEIRSSKHRSMMEATGNLIALDQTLLSVESSGKITYLNLPEGESVEKGQLLIKLNDSELKAQLEKLQTQENLAIEKEKRKKKSLEIQGISKDEYETALNDLQMIRAEKKILLSRIAKTELRAPFAGILGLRNVSEGAYVREGDPVISLVKRDPIGIEFNVPEYQSFMITMGQEVAFSIDGISDSMQAKVYAYEPSIDLEARSLKVRAKLRNPGQKLKPGAFAQVHLSGSKNTQAIFIPNEALIPILKGYKVFIVKQGKAKEIQVETGERDEEKVLIKSGLADGDSLIISGIMRLREGSVVQIIENTPHE